MHEIAIVRGNAGFTGNENCAELVVHKSVVRLRLLQHTCVFRHIDNLGSGPTGTVDLDEPAEVPPRVPIQCPGLVIAEIPREGRQIESRTRPEALDVVPPITRSSHSPGRSSLIGPLSRFALGLKRNWSKSPHHAGDFDSPFRHSVLKVQISGGILGGRRPFKNKSNPLAALS